MKDVSDHHMELAERLIQQLGGKRAAHRAIDKAGSKGKAARQKGTQQYLETDLKLLFESELLQTEYRLEDRKRDARGSSPIEPKGRKLIAQVVRQKTNQGALGKNEKAVVARLAKRGSLATVLIELIREHRPDLAKLLPEDADARRRSIENDPGKANLAAVLSLLMMAQALQKRHPRLCSKVPATLNEA